MHCARVKTNLICYFNKIMAKYCKNELLFSFLQNFWEKVEKSIIYYRILDITDKPSPNMDNATCKSTH